MMAALKVGPYDQRLTPREEFSKYRQKSILISPALSIRE
jgi:hypothetical protein